MLGPCRPCTEVTEAHFWVQTGIAYLSYHANVLRSMLTRQVVLFCILLRLMEQSLHIDCEVMIWGGCPIHSGPCRLKPVHHRKKKMKWLLNIRDHSEFMTSGRVEVLTRTAHQKLLRIYRNTQTWLVNTMQLHDLAKTNHLGYLFFRVYLTLSPHCWLSTRWARFVFAAVVENGWHSKVSFFSICKR